MREYQGRIEQNLVRNLAQMIEDSFVLRLPEQLASAVVMSAPHGGQKLPDALLAQSPVGREALLATSDFWTDQLVHQPYFPSIAARYARVLVDLNRDPSWMDASVVEDARPMNNAYVNAGYGVIPKFARRGALVRREKLTQNAAQALLAQYFDPFHSRLQALLDLVHRRIGEVVLIDVHSAPAAAMRDMDIVLGTCHGRSIAAEYIDAIEESFLSQFKAVRREKPFSGGYITAHYGKPDQGVHVVQVEISRALSETKNREISQDFLKKWALVIAEIERNFARDGFEKLAAE